MVHMDSFHLVRSWGYEQDIWRDKSQYMLTQSLSFPPSSYINQVGLALWLREVSTDLWGTGCISTCLKKE